MKYIWYLSSVFTMAIVLINNPKSSSLGNMSNQGTPINLTRSTQNGLQIATVLGVLIFLMLTVLTNVYSIF